MKYTEPIIKTMKLFKPKKIIDRNYCNFFFTDTKPSINIPLIRHASGDLHVSILTDETSHFKCYFITNHPMTILKIYTDRSLLYQRLIYKF